MVDGVYRVTATPLGASAASSVTENPARLCARCGWVDGRVPTVALLSPCVPHQIRVGFIPTARKD